MKLSRLLLASVAVAIATFSGWVKAVENSSPLVGTCVWGATRFLPWKPTRYLPFWWKSDRLYTLFPGRPHGRVFSERKPI